MEEVKQPALGTPVAPMLTPQQIEKIGAAITARGVTAPCPRCGNATFTIVPGIARIPVTAPDASQSFLAGPNLPCVTAICGRCGFISLHALGTLGFLDANGNFTGL
jgi:hypothetical protein